MNIINRCKKFMELGGLMLRIVALAHDGTLHKDISLDDLSGNKYRWYWVDFENPTQNESALLSTFFIFILLRLKTVFYIFKDLSLTIMKIILFCFSCLKSGNLGGERNRLFPGEKFHRYLSL